jgi:hypothetical protein
MRALERNDLMPHFDAALSDADRLAAAESETGLAIAELAACFESFGDDCEFGFLQRRCGAEPLGYFRFSNPGHDVILKAVTSRFDCFADTTELELDQQQPRREWIVVDRVHGLREHTFIFEGDKEEHTIRVQQMRRLAFLRRLAAGNLAEGNKIYVIKSGHGSLTTNICGRLSTALQAAGPNILLWVEPGEDVGFVEQLGAGLFRGTIDRLTIQPDAPRFSLAGWLAVLTGAWRAIGGQHASYFKR